MSIRKIQFILSLFFLTAYITLVVAIVFVEMSDTLNMEKGGNSMMGEMKVLLGVLTAGVGQILNFWFSVAKDSEEATTGV